MSNIKNRVIAMILVVLMLISIMPTTLLADGLTGISAGFKPFSDEPLITVTVKRVNGKTDWGYGGEIEVNDAPQMTFTCTKAELANWQTNENYLKIATPTIEDKSGVPYTLSPSESKLEQNEWAPTFATIYAVYEKPYTITIQYLATDNTELQSSNSIYAFADTLDKAAIEDNDQFKELVALYADKAMVGPASKISCAFEKIEYPGYIDTNNKAATVVFRYKMPSKVALIVGTQIDHDEGKSYIKDKNITIEFTREGYSNDIVLRNSGTTLKAVQVGETDSYTYSCEISAVTSNQLYFDGFLTRKRLLYGSQKSTIM